MLRTSLHFGQLERLLQAERRGSGAKERLDESMTREQGREKLLPSIFHG